MKITKYRLKNLIEFIQANFEDALMIFLWVVMWSLFEPWLLKIHAVYRIILVILVLMLVNKRLLKFPKKKKRRRKRVTLNEVAEKLDNLGDRI